MNVLPLLDGDFVELCAAAAAGRLGATDHGWRHKATVCKYLVPKDYPDVAPAPARIDVPPELRGAAQLRWFWAACRSEDGQVFLTSSRSGAFVGIADTIEEAERIAEDAAQALEKHNAGVIRHRHDIGTDELLERRLAHMRSLRAPARD
jgi:phosphoribosylamine---glycine ligase